MFPARQSTPISIAGERGYRYGELPDDLERVLPEWIAKRSVPDGEVVKPDNVFRWRGYLAKFSPPGTRWRDRLRPNAALRAVRVLSRLGPVKAPRPWVAMAGPSGLMVSDFIEGDFIERLWRTEPEAMDRLVELLAAMHARRLFHGDFHAHNLIWDGTDWYLLDLESVRHPLRCLRPRRLILDHWARLHIGLDRSPDVEPHFRRYLSLAGLPWDAEASWREVTELADRLYRRWVHGET